MIPQTNWKKYLFSGKITMADYDDNEIQLAEAKTVDKTDKKCPSCGGPITFSPASGKLVCDYCGYEEEVKKDPPKAAAVSATTGAAASAAATSVAASDNKNSGSKETVNAKRNKSGNNIPGIPIDKAPEQANTNWGDEKKVVKCKSCGASAVYDAKQISDTCPYCDSTLVTQENEEKVMAPQGIIPFSVDREKAGKEFSKWIKGLWFAPNDLQKRAARGEINGMYAPYWAYDTASDAKYKGEYGIEREETDSDGNTHTKIDWYPTKGEISHQFDDKLILSADKQNADLIKDIEPFDMEACKEYLPEYVAGFISERYAKGVNECWQTAQEELKYALKDMADKQIRTKHSTSHSRVNTLEAKFYETYYKYILLPLWLSSYRYKGTVYHFVINGQTGEVSGNRPYSILKIFLTVVCAAIFIWSFVDDDNMFMWIILGIIASIISWIIAKIFA